MATRLRAERDFSRLQNTQADSEIERPAVVDMGLGLFHRWESSWRVKTTIGLRMSEYISMLGLYDVHRDDFNFIFSARYCYHTVFNDLCDTDVISTVLK